MAPGLAATKDEVGGNNGENMNATQTTNENPISMRQLLEAGVHFGHNTGRWNPKMRPYLFGARNGIHIIDLQHTVTLFKKAFQAVIDTTARGELVLFVGTKKQGQEVIREEATRSNMLHVTQRWLGGTLTNFKTVKSSLDRLRDLEKLEEDGTLLLMQKKEQVRIGREREKLTRSLGGIKHMTKLPGMMFVIDPRKEHIAVAEARKLRIPICAITDSNCDPDVVDYVIPGNDDAIRAIKLFANRIADACIIGARLNKERAAGGNKKEVAQSEKIIHVSSGGDGPTVEIASGGSHLTPEASATPDGE